MREHVTIPKHERTQELTHINAPFRSAESTAGPPRPAPSRAHPPPRGRFDIDVPPADFPCRVEGIGPVLTRLWLLVEGAARTFCPLHQLSRAGIGMSPSMPPMPLSLPFNPAFYRVALRLHAPIHRHEPPSVGITRPAIRPQEHAAAERAVGLPIVELLTELLPDLRLRQRALVDPPAFRLHGEAGLRHRDLAVPDDRSELRDLVLMVSV